MGYIGIDKGDETHRAGVYVGQRRISWVALVGVLVALIVVLMVLQAYGVVHVNKLARANRMVSADLQKLQKMTEQVFSSMSASHQELAPVVTAK